MQDLQHKMAIRLKGQKKTFTRPFCISKEFSIGQLIIFSSFQIFLKLLH